MEQFQWGKMDKTPEGNLGREQLRGREQGNTLDELAATYGKNAKEILVGKDAISAKDEIARFSKRIGEAKGQDLYDELGNLLNALYRRRPGILEFIPDEENERAAFALALVREYERSLQ